MATAWSAYEYPCAWNAQSERLSRQLPSAAGQEVLARDVHDDIVGGIPELFQ
jgi:hypothetical protein